MVLPQQIPQGGRVALDAIGGADDQDGVVQHLQGAFHLGGEIHVTGGVQQGDDLGGQGEDGLLGEDGDAPLPLQGEGVQKGGAVIHAAHLFDAAAQVEQPFGEGGLAGVHVSQDAHDQLSVLFFHIVSHPIDRVIFPSRIHENASGCKKTARKSPVCWPIFQLFSQKIDGTPGLCYDNVRTQTRARSGGKEGEGCVDFLNCTRR